MYIVIQENYYGYEDGGYSVQAAYGPFDTERQADDFRRVKEAENLYGIEYETRKLRTEGTR